MLYFFMLYKKAHIKGIYVPNVATIQIQACVIQPKVLVVMPGFNNITS